jgi:hypothetical protein
MAVDLVTVYLNEREQRLACDVGRARNESNLTQGVTDARIATDRSSLRINIEGMGGELAFCKIHNCYPDLEIRLQAGTVDCSPFGVMVDVKTTTCPYGKLLVAVTKKDVLAVDVYALMLADQVSPDTGVPTRYRFAGTAHRSRIIQPERIRDHGHGPTYTLEQDQLDRDAFLDYMAPAYRVVPSRGR